MKFGVVLPHHDIGTDPGAIRAYAHGVEQMGASHVLIYDHVVGAQRDRPGGFEGPYDSDTAFHEPFVTFGFMAACTTTIELVTAILILGQRQTVLVAKQAAEVAILSGNRLVLGVGVGWNRVEYAALNEDFSNRGARQEEQIELLRRLWAEDAFSFDGKYHRFELASILPRPTQPIPVLLGGSAPALRERCARLGDGWIPLGGPSDKLAARLDEMRALRQSRGLAWDGFRVQGRIDLADGEPERWRSLATAWTALGATHVAVSTHDAEPVGVDVHLERVAAFRAATSDLFT